MGSLTDLLISLGIAVAAVAIGLGVHQVLSSLLHRRHSRKPLTFRGLPLNLGFWQGPLRVILPGICLAIAVPFLDFPARATSLLIQGITLWLIGGFSWLIIRTIAMAREMILSRFDVGVKDNLGARRVSTQIRVFERVLVSVVVVLTIALMLMTFQSVRQIGVSILASAGAVGLVMGFAAQKSLTAILAGLQIAITQPVRLGDAVLVEGEFGSIEEITLTFVVVKLWDQRRLIVPITHFIEKPFQNWTRSASQLVGSVFIYTDYSLPVPEVRAELDRIVRGTNLWDGRVCKLQVTNVTSEGLELRALASAGDSAQTWDLRCHVREQIVEFIKDRFPESLPRTRINLGRRHESQHGKTEARVASSMATSA